MSLISPFVVLMFSAAMIPLSGLAADSTNVVENLPAAKWDFEESGGLVMKIGWGTDPAKRAFYRAFRDFNPLNDIGIG